MMLRLLPMLALGFFSCQMPKPLSSDIAQAVSHPQRLASDLSRDAERLPVEVLNFFQIKPGMMVADVMAGDGYYTEILSRIVGPNGEVYCQNTSIPLRVFAEAPLSARLNDARLANVIRLDMEFTDEGFPRDLDVALLVRFYHDFGWQEVDRVAFNALMFASLKPGGAFCVVDHHAKSGAGISEGRRLHRVEADFLQKEVEAAGFVLESQSMILTDPTDAMDWSIFDPEHEGRDTTSRFVYLFRKPLR